MHRPQPIAIVLFVALFAGQTLVALGAPCEEPQKAPRHECCCDTQREADGCGCYDTPKESPTREPVTQVRPAPVVATLISTTIPAPNPTPRRLTTVETLHLPAPPPQRAHDVRAPPALW